MHESRPDLAELAHLLDASHANMSAKMRTTFTEERRMSAEAVVAKLRGVFTLNLATVDGQGRPLLAPIDGLFYRGHVYFSAGSDSLRMQHLLAGRTAVSASYIEQETLAIIWHGTAQLMDMSAESSRGFRDYLSECYGIPGDNLPVSGVTAWIRPRVMFATAGDY